MTDFQPQGCHRRLVEAAAQEFGRDGFRGASVDRIAAAAGVAKQTLYNHFPSKEALFEETIRCHVRDIVVELGDAQGGIRERLLAFGDTFRQRLLSQGGLEWYRMMVGELSRMPELGGMVWHQGILATQRHLADFLAAAMTRGELRHDDPAFAAEMLCSMLINSDRTRGLLADDPVSPADPQRVSSIINCFLRAYRPD
ncbi:MAG: TetR/AcrR family transcriptional regulator [Zoogloeaceae bacterium]|nr:TetR/AcrR family transcriptional regulator [Zoogloeaceae bacterium]